jgi:meiotically up-regulated gene 157 (Mug157) protein
MYLYDFHIFKLNNLKVIHSLYSQCLTQTLSKTISNRREQYIAPVVVMQVDYNVVHLRTSLVQLFVLLLQNFKVVQMLN